MYNPYQIHLLQEKHRRAEFELKAEKHRLVREALAGRRRYRLQSPLLASLGMRLVHLGTSMQQRFGSEDERYNEPSFRSA